jgi:hypothetical protein
MAGHQSASGARLPNRVTLQIGPTPCDARHRRKRTDRLFGLSLLCSADYLHAEALVAICPYYRVERMFFVERRTRRRVGPPAPGIDHRVAPWCAHLYSPVSQYLATRVVGGADKLRCAGELERCHIPLTRRPKL